MAGFKNLRDFNAALVGGRYYWATVRKTPTQATIAGWWSDLSMTSGQPKPNYYASAPLEAAVLDPYDGIFHGANKSPQTMHLTGMGLMSPTAGFVGQFTLCDYLLYYPFVDGDETSTQDMDNTVPIPRYTDGDGVQVMAVVVAPTTGGGTFTFDYINQDGDAKTSPVQRLSTTAANIGQLGTSQQAVGGTGPFLTLASGDTGVRAITAVNMIIVNGGLLSLVLVRPLGDLAIREINTMSEIEYVSKRAGCPRIYDGAYLNLICNTAATIAAGTLAGWVSFAWSES